MRQQSFHDYLLIEIASCRMALVTLYETRDRLLYVEAPPLRKKYMELFGLTEEKVLEAELEVSLLQRKLELIQSAVNRREKVDMSVIEEKLEEEKAAKLAELESNDKTLNELPQLSEQEQHTMQWQYRQITNTFHPSMNPDLTETQRELYEKAVNAYQRQDVDSMKLIYEMLFAPKDDGDGLAFSVKASEAASGETREQYREIASELSTDYYLAKRLFPAFSPLEEDTVVLDVINSYEEQKKEVESEIGSIREGFPFNAVETMNRPEMTEEYLDELRFRAKRCEKEKAELERKIAVLSGEKING